jgi:hypothetical protein
MMTHDELLKVVNWSVELAEAQYLQELLNQMKALRAVVELAGKDIEHESYVWLDGYDYAMKQIVQAIEKELR